MGQTALKERTQARAGAPRRGCVLADNHKLLASLEPAGVFEAFELLLTIPRDSGREDQLMTAVQDWAARHGFEFQRDAKGNRAVYIPGRGTGSQSEPVIVQGHADMVCVKGKDVPHDFEQDPIVLRLEEAPIANVREQVLMAKGTSLGADNGIGVAMAMAAATDGSMADSPPLILLLTVEEETGLRGAIELDPALMRGAQKLINLDSEEDGVITIGCAGATDYSITYALARDERTDKVPLLISLSDWPGGHSAGVIHEPRLNAIKALLEVVADTAAQFTTLQLSEIQGGEKTNSIPAAASAVVWVPKDRKNEVEAYISARNPLTGMDAKTAALHGDAQYSVLSPETAAFLLPWSRADTEKTLQILQAIPHGVLSFSSVYEGMVETSSNLALMSTSERGCTVRCFTRSSVPGLSRQIAQETAALFPPEALLEEHSTYEPWEPKEGTKLLKIARETAMEMGTGSPRVNAVHGGLEVAFILSKLPEGAEGISIGPDIRNPHGTKESVSVPSVAHTYEYFKRLLGQLV